MILVVRIWYQPQQNQLDSPDHHAQHKQITPMHITIKLHHEDGKDHLDDQWNIEKSFVLRIAYKLALSWVETENP